MDFDDCVIVSLGGITDLEGFKITQFEVDDDVAQAIYDAGAINAPVAPADMLAALRIGLIDAIVTTPVKRGGPWPRSVFPERRTPRRRAGSRHAQPRGRGRRDHGWRRR